MLLVNLSPMPLVEHFHPGSCVTVAIVGGSGSGKSWLAEKLAGALRSNALRLSLDDFYRDRSHLSSERRARLNFDHPRSIDWTAFEKTVRSLLAGRAVRIPSYDFATHSRLPNTRLLKPRPVILADGLWLLGRRSLKRLFVLRVYIDCSLRTRLRRRLARDLVTRGRTDASVRKQFHTTVEPMHQKYVMPQKQHADLVVSEEFGMRELHLLKATIKALRARRPVQPPVRRRTPQKSFRRGR
jgi:uridine kinase